MILKVNRKYKKDTYTIGNLYIDGVWFSNTIEDKDRGLSDIMSEGEINSIKVYGETAIPTGEYIIDMDTISPKFRHRKWAIPYDGKLPRLKNVKGFSGVLIHPMNYASESLGCIGVGVNKQKGAILESTPYFHQLMLKLNMARNRGEEIKIIIE